MDTIRHAAYSIVCQECKLKQSADRLVVQFYTRFKAPLKKFSFTAFSFP